MRDKCFDEGMIQAFFDGELEASQLELVARHVSDCSPCAVMMSEIEAESASVTAALEIDNFELVPTERLRTKIFAEIAEYENGSSWLTKAAAALGFTGGFRWTSPSVAAFASLVLVVGVVAGLLYVRPADNGGTIAGVKPLPVPASNAQTVPAQQSAPLTSAPSIPATVASRPSVSDDTLMARKALYVETRSPRTDIQPAIASETQMVDGEESYLRTIKTLKHSVDIRKEGTLKPSALVSYERDMAVIDSAIGMMQKAVRKNPKDEAAKQVLFASYQNKIDLLSSVSDKTDLMASLR
jgi:ribosomal protein S15P/S13E